MVADPDVEIPKAFAFLKQQWEAAVVDLVTFTTPSTLCGW